MVLEVGQEQGAHAHRVDEHILGALLRDFRRLGLLDEIVGVQVDVYKRQGSDFSQIDFLFDNTAMALAELYFQWKDNGKLDYDHEEAIWDKAVSYTHLDVYKRQV